jgi:hypothetical protein
MTKYSKCDLCAKDFEQGSGAELKIKNLDTNLWKLADLCGTCATKHIYQTLAEVPWRKYNNTTKKFDKYEGA